MTNDQISNKVYLLINFYLKEQKIKSEDQAIIQAGADLIINLLQNINTIASK
jgi:hypothetical protein